jgi:hypothetical protein
MQTMKTARLAMYTTRRTASATFSESVFGGFGFDTFMSSGVKFSTDARRASESALRSGSAKKASEKDSGSVRALCLPFVNTNVSFTARKPNDPPQYARLVDIIAEGGV